MDQDLNRYFVTVNHPKRGDAKALVWATDLDSALHVGEREIVDRLGGPRSQYTATKACRFPLEGIISRKEKIVFHIDEGITVTAEQRALIERYGLTVKAGKKDHVFVSDPLVVEAFGSATGHIKGTDLETLINEMVDSHDTAVRKNAKPVVPLVAVTVEGEAVVPTPVAAAPRGKKAKAKPTRSSGWDEFPDAAKIRILVKECPRKPGTAAAEHWKKYKEGMTVKAFRAAGGERGRLQTDIKRGSLKLDK